MRGAIEQSAGHQRDLTIIAVNISGLTSLMDLVHFRWHQHPVNPAKSRDITGVVPYSKSAGAYACRDKYDWFNAI
jgi:hypothetical protein